MRLIPRPKWPHMIVLVSAMLISVTIDAADESRLTPKESFGPLRSPDQILNPPDGSLVPRPAELTFRHVHFFPRPSVRVGQIADSLLSVGMEPDEVSRVLKEHQIKGVAIAGGFTITQYYRTSRPVDPVLAVHFRRDAKRVYRVTEWSTEQ